MKTKTNNVDTVYGGSSQFSWLERDPRQVILFAGYPFSKDYNDDRGHINMLEDVRATKRLNLDDSDPKHTPATCYSCKSSDNPGLWAELGMEAYDKMSFNEMTPNINNTIGCANCHEAETMRLIVTNPALKEAFERQGKDWETFSRQEMRTVVCANCHVEYYFKGDGKYLTFPWDNGTTVVEISLIMKKRVSKIGCIQKLKPPCLRHSILNMNSSPRVPRTTTRVFPAQIVTCHTQATAPQNTLHTMCIVHCLMLNNLVVNAMRIQSLSLNV
ncbi:MAG: ammonia-forming cytochrome c nitrite reductase subunit c552 [Anaerolineales bacterium]|nr:ammonia-forming cytochrome c nitrite reductase subunit c552 [Anaerolineales bacterium]